MLIYDWDGSFFTAAMDEDAVGETSAVISNNELLGDKLDFCHLKTEWNAYWCLTDKFTILEFEDISPDKELIMVAPITLSNGVWENEVNAYREWEWEGGEPLNHRLMRFINLVLT